MTYTGLFCCVAMIVIAIYDGIVVTRWGVACSVSKWLQRTALASPLFSFGFGFLAGHFFGYMAPDGVSPTVNGSNQWIIYMIVGGLILSGVGLLTLLIKSRRDTQ